LRCVAEATFGVATDSVDGCEGGRFETISVFRSTGFFRGELHEVELAPR